MAKRRPKNKNPDNSFMKKGGNNVSKRDHVLTSDGRVFFPCQYCNRAFLGKKGRSVHSRKCASKDYILSALNTQNDSNNAKTEPQKKIEIKQNIVLDTQLKVGLFSPPIKLTIRRNVIGASKTELFTVTNSLLYKDLAVESEDYTKEIKARLELLRHSRKSYPKIQMALSELKKYYSLEDRSHCPVCNKPLKSTYRSAFVKHLFTHTNELKYSCAICKQKFRRVDHMRTHQKRHVLEDGGKKA